MAKVFVAALKHLPWPWSSLVQGAHWDLEVFSTTKTSTGVFTMALRRSAWPRASQWPQVLTGNLKCSLGPQGCHRGQDHFQGLHRSQRLRHGLELLTVARAFTTGPGVLPTATSLAVARRPWPWPWGARPCCQGAHETLAVVSGCSPLPSAWPGVLLVTSRVAPKHTLWPHRGPNACTVTTAPPAVAGRDPRVPVAGEGRGPSPSPRAAATHRCPFLFSPPRCSRAGARG